jgi:hypothetical protein
MIRINSIIGLSPFSFTFFNKGGPGNLIPGRPTTLSTTYTRPAGAGVSVILQTFSGAFVTDGGAHLTERPLGQFMVTFAVSGSNTLSCTVILSDSNGDDPVQIFANGALLFFN